MTASVEIRRLYENAPAADGFRVFVDRLWPRGVSRDDFKFDLWCKNLAPSPGLRKWFGHKEQNWPEFHERYQAELRTPEQRQRIQDVVQQAAGKNIILLYGAKSREHNHAVILAQEMRRHL